MILFFYNFAILAALILGAPWWLWKMATTHKYREGLLERLGHAPVRLNQPKPVIWLHAVSVGEVLAVSRLVSELDLAFPGHQLLISTTTQTGQKLARQRFGANRVFYCPFDLRWAVRAYLNALKPKMLILAETEFWPNLLSGCFRRDIPVAVVNARISDRSWPRYLKLRSLWQPFLSRLSAVLAQTETDADRLRAIGCAPGRVSVAGNLKFDVRVVEDAEATSLLKFLAPSPKILVAGSTLEGEEAALIAAHKSICCANPLLITVLAPRHPERFEAVAAMLQSSGVQWFRRSDFKGKGFSDLKPLGGSEIVLLDSIGELASVYSIGRVAFIGGSLVPAGGHNPLEPAQFGVPIVMGPHYANFRAIVDELLAHQALCITATEDLAPSIIHLLTNTGEAKAMGARARHVFDQQAGATARCLDAIQQLIPARQAVKEPA
jgi:3-deoxy-D-manno-octulosonic-acid transferase